MEEDCISGAQGPNHEYRSAIMAIAATSRVVEHPSLCPSFLRVTASDCESCSLRPHTLFADAQTSDLKRLTGNIRNGILRRGQVIYAAGDVGPSVFTIRVGMVKLILEVPGQEDRIVRLLGRGAALGLEALAGHPYAHTAVTLRTTSLCEIPVQTLDELQVHKLRVSSGLMRKWNEQVARADRWIATLGSGPVKQRLVDLLRLIADIGGDSPDAVHIPPVADISAMLGISPESISRHMAELKRAGLLIHVAPRTYRCAPALLEAAGPQLAPGRATVAAVPPHRSAT